MDPRPIDPRRIDPHFIDPHFIDPKTGKEIRLTAYAACAG
jgi:hypothetical protein